MNKFIFGLELDGSVSTKKLVEISNELNKHLPKHVDSLTILETTTAYENKLVYSYRVETDTTIELTEDDIKTAIGDVILNKICSDPDTRGLLNAKVQMVYKYYDSKSRFISQLSYDISSCK